MTNFPEGTEDDGLNMGQRIGIGVGVSFGVIFICCRKHRAQQNRQNQRRDNPAQPSQSAVAPSARPQAQPNGTATGANINEGIDRISISSENILPPPTEFPTQVSLDTDPPPPFQEHWAIPEQPPPSYNEAVAMTVLDPSVLYSPGERGLEATPR